MTLTAEQSQSYDDIHRWLKDGSNWMFTLHGFAGTGKTYLMQHLINNYVGDVLCCAPTGKAASVLQKKLAGHDVTTIHKAIYAPAQREPEEYKIMKARLKTNPDDKTLADKVEEMRKELTSSKLSFSFTGGNDIIPGQLIVVDEASMVTRIMREDLEATKTKVLFVGDGGQLPPVGDDGWFINDKPDFLLQEIQRQALDSPIIRLSMAIREGFVDKSQFIGESCRITSKASLEHQDWLDADQVITGRNATRHKLNKWFRRKLEYHELSQLPIAGEKLICLKNGQNSPFINGVQFQCIDDAIIDGQLGEAVIDINYDDHIYTGVPFYDYHCLRTYDPTQKEEPFYTRWGLMELDYAYAITCHKSQGSEWDNVILADDYMMRNKTDFRKRWLYTGVTRAKEKLTWIQD